MTLRKKLISLVLFGCLAAPSILWGVHDQDLTELPYLKASKIFNIQKTAPSIHFCAGTSFPLANFDLLYNTISVNYYSSAQFIFKAVFTAQFLRNFNGLTIKINAP